MMRTKTAEIQKYISSLAYPCSRAELVAHARKLGASREAIQTIQSLPYDYFMTPHSVWNAIK